MAHEVHESKTLHQHKEFDNIVSPPRQARFQFHIAMTRTKHTAHPTPAFPVACLKFADDTTLLLGGGGGPSRTGIANKLKLCSASSDGSVLKTVTEHVFQPGEDTPTSMAVDQARKQVVVGVNSAETSIKDGKGNEGNDHCRAFSYSEQQLNLVKQTQTITSVWSDDYPYQKFTALDPTCSHLAVGTTDGTGTESTVTLLSYPEMSYIWKWESKDSAKDGELVDIDFNTDGSTLAITTTTTINIYQIEQGVSEKASIVSQTSSVSIPIIGNDPIAFRSAKFTRDASRKPTLHAILNSNPKPTPRGKGKRPLSIKKGYCCNFSYIATPTKKESKESNLSGSWDLICQRDLGNKPVSAFEVSADGAVLAYASADYSIGLLDSLTLAPLLKILHAHSFAITALAFNPTGNLLASAGADNTVRLIVIPSSFGSSAMTIILAILAIFLALLAYFLQTRSS